MKKIFSEKVVSILSLVLGILSAVLSLIVSFFKHSYSKELMFLIFLTCLMFSVIFTFLFYIRKKIIKEKQGRYDSIREDLELKIIEIQKKLSQTEEQWEVSNHLLLSSQKNSGIKNSDEIRNLTFLKNFGLSPEEFVIDEKMVFYLTSFSLEYDSIYRTCKETCKSMGLKLLRGDEDVVTGEIFSQIIRNIVKSSLIIANIDGKNPNVFYELGIAHSLGKNIMFISKRENEMPFDIRQYRTLFYNDEEDLKKTLPVHLEMYINYISKQNEKTKSDGKETTIEKLIENEELGKALELCKEELIRNPQSYTYLLLIAKIFSRSGDYEKSTQYYQKAIEIKSKNN